MKSSEMSVLFTEPNGMPIALVPYYEIDNLKLIEGGVSVTLRDGFSFSAANDRKDIRSQVGVFRLWRLLLS